VVEGEADDGARRRASMGHVRVSVWRAGSNGLPLSVALAAAHRR
jgi:hypothetical protein